MNGFRELVDLGQILFYFIYREYGNDIHKMGDIVNQELSFAWLIMPKKQTARSAHRAAMFLLVNNVVLFEISSF